MQIVIDIPDFIYKALKEDVDCGTVNLNHAIVNGIPLPKGHGDLIDRTALLYEMMMTPVAERNFSNCVECVEYVPTLIKADDEEED